MRFENTRAAVSLLYRASLLGLLLLVSACGGGGDAACNAGLGSLVSAATNCGPAPNDAPVAKTGTIQNVSVDTVVILDGSASSDPNKDLITYKWEITSKPAGSSAILDSDASAKPSFKADLPGSYSVKLVVNDGKLLSAAATATVVASLNNSAPVAKAGSAQSVAVLTEVMLDGTGSLDADGNLITYKWAIVSKPAGSEAVLKFPTTPIPKFTADKVGIYVVGLVVNDGRFDSEPSVVTVQAFVANVTPVANAGTAQNAVVGTPITLDGRASSDANLDQLIFNWALVSVPDKSTAALVSKNSSTPTFTPDQAGTYVFSLIVNDGKVDSSVSVVVVSASKANVAPVASAGENQTVISGATVKLDGALSLDANNDPLTYNWTLVSRPTESSAVILLPTTVRPTFVADKVGTYVVSLKVKDGKIDSDVALVIITATEAPSGLAGS
jgi:hypothetical protein